MSADQHLQPHQLKMFMSAREVVNNYELLDRIGPSGEPRRAGGVLGWSASGRTPAVVDSHPMTKDDLLRAKLKESSPRWNRAVQRDGVHEPIEIAHDSTLRFFSQPHTGVSNGHHRLAAIMADNPDRLVPVEHIDDVSKRRRSGGGWF